MYVVQFLKILCLEDVLSNSFQLTISTTFHDKQQQIHEASPNDSNNDTSFYALPLQLQEQSLKITHHYSLFTAEEILS